MLTASITAAPAVVSGSLLRPHDRARRTPLTADRPRSPAAADRLPPSTRP